MKKSILCLFIFVIGISHSCMTKARAEVFNDNFNDGIIDNYWSTFGTLPNSYITEDSGTLSIHVPTTPTDFQDKGLESIDRYPRLDFECSVDFRIPEGNSMAWLTAVVRPDNGLDTGFWCVYYNVGNYYTWYRNEAGYGWEYGMSGFGDEDTSWHTFKLTYDAETMTGMAYVDNIFLNSKIVDLNNFAVHISTKAGSYTATPSTVEFDNFSFFIIPEPATLSLFALGTIVLIKRKKK